MAARGFRISSKAKASLDRLVEMFASERLPEAVAQTVMLREQSDAPSAKWSLSNRLIMLAGGTTDARGFKQWQEVGRRVKEGAKAFHILGPMTKTIRERDKDRGEDAERRIVAGFKSIPVFGYEETEGEDIEIPDYRPLHLPPLSEVADALGVRVSYAPFVADALGFYRPGRKSMTLCTHDVRTFFHELAHAAHDAVTPGGLKAGQDPEQEVVAETVAATLCIMYGFEGYVAHSRKYVECYAAEGDSAGRAVMRVLGQVEKVLDCILSLADTPIVLTTG